MKQQKLKNRFSNSQSGSAMILALTAVALLGLMASATLTVSGLMAQEAARTTQVTYINNFAQLLETIVTNPASCLKTTNSGSMTNLNGLQFLTAGSQNCPAATCFANALLPAGLTVFLDTPLGNSSVGAFPSAGVQVNRLYLTNGSVLSTSGLAYTARADLMASLSSINPTYAFAPRLIATVTLNFDSASNLAACSAMASPQALCLQMNCKYDGTASGQKCWCGFPTLDCNSPATNPRSYISGFNVNPTTGQITPKCTQVSLDCSNPAYGGIGPGYFLAGIDSSGKPICLAAEGTVSGPPPTGTAPVAGQCGSAQGASLSSPPTSANGCSQGTFQNVAGTGPWTWDCAGLNGGSTISCASGASTAPLLCLGVPKPTAACGRATCAWPNHWIFCGGNFWDCDPVSGWVCVHDDICGTNLVQCP